MRTRGAFALLCILFLAAAPAIFAAYPPGLVSYWPFDSNANDALGVNNGTVSGATLQAAGGQVGGAYSFNTSQYIALPNASSSLNLPVFSISVWVRPASFTTSYPTIIRKYGVSDQGYNENYHLRVSANANDGLVLFRIGSGPPSNQSASVVSTAPIPLNQWTLITATFDGSNSSLYINGILNSSASVNFTPQYSQTTKDYVGIYGGDGYNTYGFNGSIDELAIYNRSLSASEASQLYNASKGGVTNYFGDCVQSCPSFGLGTESNNSILARTSAFVNVTIQSIASLANFTFNWNGTSYSPYDSSLLGMWNLDNNSAVGDSATVAADASGNGNNGNIVSAQWGPGKYGLGLLFFGNATGSRASVPDNNRTDIYSANITLSAWIKFTQLQEYFSSGYYFGSIAGKGWLATVPDGGYGLYVGNDSIYWQVRKDPAVVFLTSPGAYRDGQWHNAVGVLSRGSSPNLLLYVDGALVNSTTNTSLDSLSLNSNYSFDIGVSEAVPGTYRFYFNGSIDEVRLYNRSLSASEVAMLYASNMQKINSTSWAFVSNQTGLTNGNYTYYAYGSDTSGNSNSTAPVTFTVSSQSFSGSGSASSCINLTQSGNYTLAANLSSSVTCIGILSDNVTLDCQNHSITGNNSASSYGIYVAGANAAVSNCQISNFTDALHLSGADNGAYSNNTFIASSNAHVYMDAVSYGNVISANNFTGDPAYYVYDLNGGNSLNGTAASHPQGNIYSNVMNGSVTVISFNRTASSIPGLFIGDIGSGYPYNSTTSQGKVFGSGADYAPLTQLDTYNQISVYASDNSSTIVFNNPGFSGQAYIVQVSNSTTDMAGGITGFYVLNLGNVNVSISELSTQSAAQFIGGSGAQFGFFGGVTKAGACVSGLVTSYSEFNGTYQPVCGKLGYAPSPNEIASYLRIQVPSDSPTHASYTTITFTGTPN